MNLIEKPNNFKSLIQKMIPWGKVNIVYKTQCRVSQLFRFKDSIPNDLKSHLVYYFKCPSCNAEYIGETMRHSKVRWSEHLGISCFTNLPVAGLRTPIRDHIIDKKCEASIENFKIIGREEKHNLLLIKESLFINLYKTGLNTKIKCADLSLF